MNIPDTVTMKDNGEWDRWLFTARTGEVLKRRQIDVNSLTRRFLFEDDESKITDNEALCAIARFQNGRTQILNRKDFRRVVKNQRERHGMEAIQMLMSSAKRKSSYRNEYEVVNDETGRVVRGTQKILNGSKKFQGFSTVNERGNASVRCANKRLCVQLNEITNQLVKSIENGTRCRVVHIVSEYTVDEDERIWFLWCDEMSSLRGHLYQQRVEHLGVTSPARIMRDRSKITETNDDDVDDDDVDIFVEQLTNARSLTRSDKNLNVTQKKNRKSRKSAENSLTLIASDSGGSRALDHKMPTPFACKGDFCNFAVHEPKVLTATEMYDQRTRFARKLLSKDEFRHFEQQSAYLSQDASQHQHHHEHHERRLCKITFRSIQLAREERRGRNENSEVVMEHKSHDKRPRYMRSTETRSRQSQSSSTQLSRAYEDVYVCETCREVYKILDEARHLRQRQSGAAILSTGEKKKKSKGKALLDEMLNMLQTKEKRRKEYSKKEDVDTFGELDDYLRGGGGKLRKSLYSDGLRSSDGFGKRRRSRKKSNVGILPTFGSKKKSIVSPLGSMSSTYRHHSNRELEENDSIGDDSQLFSSNFEVDFKTSKEVKQKEKDEAELSRIVGRPKKQSSPQRKERYIAKILLGEASKVVCHFF